MKNRKFTCLFLIYTIFVSLFPINASPYFGLQNFTPDEQTETKGLQFRIRAPEPQKEKTADSRFAKTINLNETAANEIFRRLPPMPFKETDKADFRIRADSLPPPKMGNITPIKFPAEKNQTPPSLDSSNLEVVRFSPAGSVAMVADLSVTFSQPMVAIASRGELARESVPVILTPNVRGKWRWLGTKTLIFDAETRFPMATEFTATIPEGTKSASGKQLMKEFSWKFATPPPRIEEFIPQNKTVGRNALMLAVFNQEINADEIAAKITGFAFDKKIKFRLATPEEIAADEEISKAVKKLLPNRWVALRAAAPLPPDSMIVVNFNAGTASMEGNLVTIEPQYRTFKTFSNLKFEKSYCGYDEDLKDCKRFQDWSLRFNNPLDEEKFDKSQVKIEPNIENAEISVSRYSIEIRGVKQNRKNYKVTVSGSLQDEFGQILGQDFSTDFKTTAEDAELNSVSGDFVTLDPNGKPEISVYSTNYPNLRVKLYAVKAEDYAAFYAYKNSERKSLPTIGKLVFEKSLKTKDVRDFSTETRINITPALENSLGHAILIVESPDKKSEPIIKWLQKTKIGVDAFADYEQITAFATDLPSGKPISGANILLSNGAKGVVGADGLTQIPLPILDEDKGDWLIASHKDDTAILLKNNYYSNGNWSKTTAKDSLRWFVFDDRKMYRPGETVSIKGYIRRVTDGKTTDIAALNGAAKNVNYVLTDSRGNEIVKGSAEINSFGAFDLKLTLPENINLGNQRLELTADSELENSVERHGFEVQEFRRPEFEVSAAVENAAPFYLGDSAILSAEAKYFSSGALPNAETDWNITARATNYTPPNREDYTFGKFVPWWNSSYNPSETTTQRIKGVTDAGGKHRIALDFTAANPARPYRIEAEAKVQDVNRQTFADSTDLLVHPSELYVGIRTPKTFVRKNEKLSIETITTDVEGKFIADAPISITAELKDWQKIKGEWEEVTLDTQTCQLKSGVAPISCEINARQGGTYTIKANVYDRRERRNESELTVWVAGGNIEPSDVVKQEDATLIPDKKQYAPNETAEILVNSPFVPAEGVLTLRRNGIVKAERFTMTESSTILRIPIEEKYLPNIYAQVDLVGTSPRVVFEDERDAKLPKRPAYASGKIELDVSTASRRLQVTAEPLIKTLEPGGETQISVVVKDFLGNPSANTEVAIVAVDESVLALTNYKIADPLDIFYQKIYEQTSDYHSRENVELYSYLPDGISIFGSNYGSNGMGSAGGISYGNNVRDIFRRMEIIASLQRPPENKSELPDKIRLRSNFDALAIFSPSVKTDAKGNAVVNVKLPDNLTRYRVTAIAVTESKQFGRTESNITAKQSLMIRPSAPRFMNFGDKIELPVVVQNQTAEALTIDVAVRASNAQLTDGNGRKITIAANDRAEIRFPAAAEKSGTARFQIGATAGKFADAAEFEFPVYTPATTETFATYGTTDQNGAIAQTVSAPSDVFSQFGGLEIKTSSTQLQELTDAFTYLQNYPFECSEQISSRVLSVAALRDVLSAFESKELPSKEEIEAKMTSDIERLVKLQHIDGGYSFWRSDDRSFPFVSVHVAHALARAKAKNYLVPEKTISRSLAYLKNIETEYPNFYSQKSRWAISSFALYVRALLGDKDSAKARTLLNEATLEKLSLESVGWLLPVLADDKNSANDASAIKQFLSNRATEAADTAHFVTDYSDGAFVLLSSSRRADGIILESLLTTDPTNDLIPKIVRGLLADKTKGRWSNTQENAFILLALDKYFQAYEKTTPNFVTRVWLGNAYAGEQKFVGRSIDSNSISVPMNYLQKQANSNLIFDKQGAGRLYYRIGLNYAPKNLKLDSTDEGFQVVRNYEPVDDANDVKQNADGSWIFQSGARIRVKLQMVASTRRYHVALVDKLPAGLEIINPDLANSEKLPNVTDDNKSNYNRRWFEHQNLRDDRAEAFTTLLPEGVWTYSYVARATTPGNFVVPPAKAEEMYAPETFGRSETLFVRVE